MTISSTRKNLVKGFTLIELLVVISIISILIAILLPALKEARRSAQAIQCLTNVKQMHLAMSGYSIDNREVYSPINDGQGAPQARHHRFWVNKLINGNYIASRFSSNNDSAEGLKSTNVFRCPTRSFEAYLATAPSYVEGKPNYGLNNQDLANVGAVPASERRRRLFADLSFSTTAANSAGVPLRRYLHGTDIKHPSTLMMLCDSERRTSLAGELRVASWMTGAGRWQPGNNEGWPAAVHGNSTPVAMLSSMGDINNLRMRQANLVYFDGHAAPMSLNDLAINTATTSSNIDPWGYMNW